MEWNQLEYFQTVARVQHMTHAAEILSISQPALSRSIARLEAELGVPLFERRGRSIILNHYGQLFLNRVNRMIKEFQEGKQELKDLLDPEYGVVSLGFLHTLGPEIIPNLIGAFRSHYPKMKFQLNQNNSYMLIKQIELGEFDLCLITPPETKLEVQWVKLWSEELFVIVPAGHPLEHRESIMLDEIRDESFILVKKRNALRQITDQLFLKADIVPRIVFEGEELHTIAGLVASGLGVSIIPDIKDLDRSKIARIRVRWPKCERAIGIAWVEGRYLSPAVKQFKEFVIDYFK
ncbi:LysR family transcriptional regulator [Bacillus sp. EB600]|uniref:LysR family transcriptional regulator n=1 Tax=Bacillus sp. EB600 TaxID=2806345 RepID=UPI00210E5E97|nr:LysR family transcriptional regulator [Bacillus sp. EB600]MCQ6279017.1 LysR family transcriptional regulator [Bacillus sp. EB600]